MILLDLEAVLRHRKAELPEQSYSATLFSDPELISRKINEEAFEVCVELGRSNRSEQRIAEESADLLFHLLVGLVDAGVELDRVFGVLEDRRS